MKSELERMEDATMEHLNSMRHTIAKSRDKLGNNLRKVQSEQARVSQISHAPHVMIKDIETQFEKATKLTRVDVAFLFVATALQCLRQYFFTMPKERVGDQEAASAIKSHEHSDRSHRLYNPDLEEIIVSPVPFDTAMGARQYGALSGFGALGHRGATPGHDPIAGLVFGTANIATSTLTNWRMESYHIYTGTIGNAKGAQDIFMRRADTNRVLSETFINKLVHQGIDGRIIVGVSVAKEIQHLRSDVYSKDSLPLPLISAINPVIAGELATRGLDMANALNTGKQLAYAIAIDTIIALIHGFFYQESDCISRSMYAARTRRILIYSNIIASGSNAVAAALAQCCAGSGGQIVDWGGYINTLRHIAFDTKKINEIKRDFLRNELYTRVVGEKYDFMEGK